jgi:predicted phosphodiesterase
MVGRRDRRTKLYFLGDIHGDYISLEFTIVQNKITNATIIQVGDFGLGLTKDEKHLLSVVNKVCKENNVMIYAIRGNHDNPHLFNSENRFSNLKFLSDYSILKVDDQTILLSGGSVSIDRLDRKANINYWYDEQFEFNEDKLAVIGASVKSIDVVVTHSAPSEVSPLKFNSSQLHWMLFDSTLKKDYRNDRNEHSKLLNYLSLARLKPSFWYYGHFHKSNTEVYDGIEFRLLNINELVEHSYTK